MATDNLTGLMTINGVDIWSQYGVFLAEEKAGGMTNMSALLTPSDVKDSTAVDFREETGEKYADDLVQTNAARDVTLTFALIADSPANWQTKYGSFISFLKSGWLSMLVYGDDYYIGVKVFYKKTTKFTPLVSLWHAGHKKYGGRFSVTFREPQPAL